MIIGEITGSSVTKNRDGDQNVRMLQVKLTSDDDVQSVEMVSQSGEDTNPPKGSSVIVIPITNSWRVGVATDDGITPSVEAGEKEIYSTDSPATTKLAKHKLDKNGNHIFNDGTKNAARQDDQVQSTSTEDTLFWAYLVALDAYLRGLGFAGPTLPTSITGKITQGTTEVKLP